MNIQLTQELASMLDKVARKHKMTKTDYITQMIFNDFIRLKLK